MSGENESQQVTVSGEQDKVSTVLSTATQGAQGSAAIAAPGNESEGESEMLPSQPQPAQQAQAGAPGLTAVETSESPAQPGNAQAAGLLGMEEVGDIANKCLEGVMERRRQRAQQDLKEASQILSEHPSWDALHQEQPQYSSTPQGGGVVSRTLQYQSSRYASARVENNPGEWKLNRTPRVSVNVLQPASPGVLRKGSRKTSDLNVTREMLAAELEKKLAEGRERAKQRKAVATVKTEPPTPVRVSESGETPARGGRMTVPVRWDDDTRSFVPMTLTAPTKTAVPAGATVEEAAGLDGQALGSSPPSDERDERGDISQEIEKEKEGLGRVVDCQAILPFRKMTFDEIVAHLSKPVDHTYRPTRTRGPGKAAGDMTWVPDDPATTAGTLTAFMDEQVRFHREVTEYLTYIREETSSVTPEQGLHKTYGALTRVGEVEAEFLELKEEWSKLDGRARMVQRVTVCECMHGLPDMSVAEWRKVPLIDKWRYCSIMGLSDMAEMLARKGRMLEQIWTMLKSLKDQWKGINDLVDWQRYLAAKVVSTGCRLVISDTDLVWTELAALSPRLDHLQTALEEREKWVNMVMTTPEGQAAKEGYLKQLEEKDAWCVDASARLEELHGLLDQERDQLEKVLGKCTSQTRLLSEKERECDELRKKASYWQQLVGDKEAEIRSMQEQLEGQEIDLQSLKEEVVAVNEDNIRLQNELAHWQLQCTAGPGDQRPPAYMDHLRQEAEQLRTRLKQEQDTQYPQVVAGESMYYGEPARERNKVEMPVNNPQGGPSNPPSLVPAVAGRGGGLVPPRPDYTSCGQGARRRYDPSVGVTFDQTQGENDTTVKDLIQEMREERLELREQMQQQRADLQQRVRALEAPVAPAAKTQMRFNGKPSSESWTAWWKKFAFAHRNATEEQRAVALWNSLEGPALELVAGSAPADGIPALGTMIDLLTARYAPVGLKDQVYGMLMQRKQKPGEKWIDFSEALTQIYNSASPNEGDSEKKRELLYAAFLAGLCDTQILVQLRIWCAGQREIPLLADAAKYCASIAGSVPERCDRFEKVQEEKETSSDQYRNGQNRGGRNGNRGKGSRVAHAQVTEGASGGDAGALNAVKNMIKERRKHIMKEMKEMQGNLQAEMKEVVKGEVRAVQQTSSATRGQETTSRFDGSRDFQSGGYQQYNNYGGYGRGGSRGRGTRGGWRGRGTARSSPEGSFYGRCFLCGGKGHSRDYCCGEEAPGATCFECGGSGHLRYSCPSKQGEMRYSASRGRGGRGRGGRGGYRGGRGGERRQEETSSPPKGEKGPIVAEATGQSGNQ